MIVTSLRGTYPIDWVTIEDIRRLLSSGCTVLTDENIARLYPDLVNAASKFLIVPAGEKSKSLTTFGDCLNRLARLKVNRKSSLVTLGGGVIGDLGGFVASAYMRGIPYVQVPTTLLAQVDSSVGGKVGIDLEEGKNLAGAFYPPQRVMIVTDFLKSLPPRQMNNGLSEVLKYGFISRPSLLSLLQENIMDHLDQIVAECIDIKAEIVEKDEFETLGLRAILNFGHTIGHAIEQVLNYRELLHGEAIAIGMVLEARLGELLGITESGSCRAIEEILVSANLPVSDKVLERPQELISAMYLDKKATDGTLTFSLLERVGDCKLVSNVPESAVREVLKIA